MIFIPFLQAAYQPGRGTVEQIFALSQVIEKSIEFNTPVYVAFIDFTKAFDSSKLRKLWEILNKSSINIRKQPTGTEAYAKYVFSRCFSPGKM